MLGDPRFRFFIEHILRVLLHDTTTAWKPGGTFPPSLPPSLPPFLEVCCLIPALPPFLPPSLRPSCFYLSCSNTSSAFPSPPFHRHSNPTFLFSFPPSLPPSLPRLHGRGDRRGPLREERGESDRGLHPLHPHCPVSEGKREGGREGGRGGVGGGRGRWGLYCEWLNRKLAFEGQSDPHAA